MTKSQLTSFLIEQRNYIRENFSRADLTGPGDDINHACSEVRLQAVDGGWTLWTGDPCYDTDHRGCWASASLPYAASDAECADIAACLIDELADDEACKADLNL